MNGILLVNKPERWTSFDVIGKLRGVLHMKRLGHAGTLDPMATGVLPVFVGYATRACGMLPDDTKSYTAGFQLGQVSTTQDCTGEILETKDFSDITAVQITQVLSHMTGLVPQLPPMYSAVKVNGQKLYDLARKGKTVERQPRTVRIESLTLTAFDPAAGTGIIEITCGGGTYVRTILHDMGQALGCGALMTSLCRTVSNGFPLQRCLTLERVQELAEREQIGSILIPLEEVFSSLPPLHLDLQQTRLYRNGVKLALDSLTLPDAERFAVFGAAEGFLGTALADREAGVLRIERNLCPPAEVTA